MKTLLLFTVVLIMLSNTLKAQDEQILTNYEGDVPQVTMNSISCTISIVENPSKTGINTSDSVAMLSMEANHDEWAGFWVSTKTDDDADSADHWIDANTYRYVHVMVYKDRISNLKFKLEGSYTGTVEKYATNPDKGTNSSTNKWEDIVIDFNEVDGFAPIWLVSPNWDDPEREASSSVVYVDNIVINNNAEPITDSGPTGLSYNENNTVKIFPNPVFDELHLSNLSGNQITITNMLGQQIMKYNSVNHAITIPMSGLEKGIYFVIISDKSGVISCNKIFKE
jgi:hypothetical protein